MFCGECGTQNPDTNQFCKNCGKPLRRPGAATVQPAVITVPPSAIPQPVSTPQPAAYPPVAVAPAGVPAPAKPPQNKAMLTLGIIGVLVGICSWFRYPYLLGILAVIFGGVVIARTENRKGTVMVIACLAILIGLSCIVVDVFYFTIFPIPHLDL